MGKKWENDCRYLKANKTTTHEYFQKAKYIKKLEMSK